MISVGQTKEKSAGYGNKTSHFPLNCDNSQYTNSRDGKTHCALKFSAGFPIFATNDWQQQFGWQWQHDCSLIFKNEMKSFR